MDVQNFHLGEQKQNFQNKTYVLFASNKMIKNCDKENDTFIENQLLDLLLVQVFSLVVYVVIKLNENHFLLHYFEESVKCDQTTNSRSNL